jgi:hypothetical protein
MTVSKDTTNRTDTTIANQERRSKEQYEKQLQEQQVAHERLQAAREEHQKAIQQYQEALLQQQEFQRQKYYESLKEAEKRLQELYLKDSLDKKLPHCILPPGNFFFDFGPGIHSFAWPDESVFQWNYQKFMESYFDSDTSWTNTYEKMDSIGAEAFKGLELPDFIDPVMPLDKHFDFFTDSLPGMYYYYKDPYDKELDFNDDRLERFIPYDLKLPDIYDNYPELEDLSEIQRVLPRDAPDLEEMYLIPHQRHLDRTESIMKSELLMDGIITKDGEYVVYIDSGMMSVNGEKQSREVFKKYKRLVETAMGEEIKKGLTYFY